MSEKPEHPQKPLLAFSLYTQLPVERLEDVDKEIRRTLDAAVGDGTVESKGRRPSSKLGTAFTMQLIADGSMPPLAIAQNDLSEPDPARAAELETAIRAAVGALEEDVSCSLLLVGFPRNWLRVEMRGLHWCENLPLMPKDIAAGTVGALAEGVVDRRRKPRKAGD